MPKKPVTLDGLLNTENRPTDTRIPQRGAASIRDKNPPKKRVTVALDGSTYRRLRLHAANTDQTHQAILESALVGYLKHTNA